MLSENELTRLMDIVRCFRRDACLKVGSTDDQELSSIQGELYTMREEYRTSVARLKATH